MDPPLQGTGSGLSGTASANKEKIPWKIPQGSEGYHVSSDASLFSSSLPVLHHEKLIFNESERRGIVLDDNFPELSKLHIGNKAKDPEDLELSPGGTFLPGDEDELLAGIMDDFDLSGLPTQLEDLDDDLFGSGGGIEIEPEFREPRVNGIANLSLPNGISGTSLGQYSIQNGGVAVSGEHPYGEHPSRTLFVRNINSNVEDLELRALFEQYGDIRTLYTACKHRGFVMISYYDIRAARTAMRALQNKPLRRRKLDIHFSIPKDNPSEKDINQGTLVVFNLDPSVSNEDIRQIFGVYGEVKEIRETPHKRHHKFIEFYDVRAADAALKALNRSDIAGKRIKLEPSRPGGARRSLMQQLGQDLERDETRSLTHQVGSPIANSPPGSWPTYGSPIELNPLVGYGQSPNLRTFSPVSSSHMSGLASILPSHGSSPAKISPIGKESGKKLGSSSGTVSPFAESTSDTSAIGTLSGPQFLWGSPTIRSERPSPSAWPLSTGNMLASDMQGQAYPYSSLQGTFLHSHHHVGSAPSGVPLERHFGFFPESSETSYMTPGSFGSSALNRNTNRVINVAPPGVMNMSVAFAGNFRESGSPSSRIMSMSRNGPLFLSNGFYGGIGTTNLDGLSDRGRTRKVETGNQIENKRQFQLDLEKIMNGEDTRTTLMIKNIPNKYTSKMLLAAIDETHMGSYDFLYLPIDFKNKCNVGYAFINMVSPSHIFSFYEVFNGKKWEKFNSEKVASLAYARIQGKTALVAHFQNSSLMNEDKRCRPIVFQSEGQGNNDQEAFFSSNLNICIRQPDGSYNGDALDSPRDDLEELQEKNFFVGSN
ncbi:hypothetical protein Leryth_023710 [Lithospermum erythrorhizon]|nr:hypothetical protein Leryth_023710 [Lithospermum erythrorhizon]